MNEPLEPSNVEPAAQSTGRRPGQSGRMSAVQPPIIPIIGDLIRRTPGTISLGQGLVSYGPPAEAIHALASFPSSLEDNRYSPVEGSEELLKALRRKLADENGIRVDGACRVVVTAGANMAFVNAVLAIADPGDEVILLTPFYFNHDMAIVIAGCRTVAVPTDAEYQPRLDAIRDAITPRTRAVVTVSPNNPTGAVYPERALRAINTLCADSGLYHIHDEAYEYFTYGQARHYSPGADPGAARHTISLYSLSKSYGMASWRIGYMVIPSRLFEAVNKIQDTNLICPPVVSQAVAMAAVSAGSAYCRERVRELSAVRAETLAALAAIRKIVTVPTPDGAFYCFVKVHTDLDAVSLAEELIVKHGVATIPGSAFGLTGECCLRVSYGALEPATVAEGMSRLVRGLVDLVRPN
jgi:aspartate/methionine/tyrosine aminotransferase